MSQQYSNQQQQQEGGGDNNRHVSGICTYSQNGGTFMQVPAILTYTSAGAAAPAQLQLLVPDPLAPGGITAIHIPPPPTAYPYQPPVQLQPLQPFQLYPYTQPQQIPVLPRPHPSSSSARLPLINAPQVLPYSSFGQPQQQRSANSASSSVAAVARDATIYSSVQPQQQQGAGQAPQQQLAALLRQPSPFFSGPVAQSVPHYSVPVAQPAPIYSVPVSQPAPIYSVPVQQVPASQQQPAASSLPGQELPGEGGRFTIGNLSPQRSSDILRILNRVVGEPSPQLSVNPPTYQQAIEQQVAQRQNTSGSEVPRHHGPPPPPVDYDNLRPHLQSVTPHPPAASNRPVESIQQVIDRTAVGFAGVVGAPSRNQAPVLSSVNYHRTHPNLFTVRPPVAAPIEISGRIPVTPRTLQGFYHDNPWAQREQPAVQQVEFPSTTPSSNAPLPPTSTSPAVSLRVQGSVGVSSAASSHQEKVPHYLTAAEIREHHRRGTLTIRDGSLRETFQHPLRGPQERPFFPPSRASGALPSVIGLSPALSAATASSLSGTIGSRLRSGQSVESIRERLERQAATLRIQREQQVLDTRINDLRSQELRLQEQQHHLSVASERLEAERRAQAEVNRVQLLELQQIHDGFAKLEDQRKKHKEEVDKNNAILEERTEAVKSGVQALAASSEKFAQSEECTEQQAALLSSQFHFGTGLAWQRQIIKDAKQHDKATTSTGDVDWKSEEEPDEHRESKADQVKKQQRRQSQLNEQERLRQVQEQPVLRLRSETGGPAIRNTRNSQFGRVPYSPQPPQHDTRASRSRSRSPRKQLHQHDTRASRSRSRSPIKQQQRSRSRSRSPRKQQQRVRSHSRSRSGPRGSRSPAVRARSRKSQLTNPTKQLRVKEEEVQQQPKGSPSWRFRRCGYSRRRAPSEEQEEKERAEAQADVPSQSARLHQSSEESDTAANRRQRHRESPARRNRRSGSEASVGGRRRTQGSREGNATSPRKTSTRRRSHSWDEPQHQPEEQPARRITRASLRYALEHPIDLSEPTSSHVAAQREQIAEQVALVVQDLNAGLQQAAAPLAPRPDFLTRLTALSQEQGGTLYGSKVYNTVGRTYDALWENRSVGHYNGEEVYIPRQCYQYLRTIKPVTRREDAVRPQDLSEADKKIYLCAYGKKLKRNEYGYSVRAAAPEQLGTAPFGFVGEDRPCYTPDFDIAPEHFKLLADLRREEEEDDGVAEENRIYRPTIEQHQAMQAALADLPEDDAIVGQDNQPVVLAGIRRQRPINKRQKQKQRRQRKRVWTRKQKKVVAKSLGTKQQDTSTTSPTEESPDQKIPPSILYPAVTARNVRRANRRNQRRIAAAINEPPTPIKRLKNSQPSHKDKRIEDHRLAREAAAKTHHDPWCPELVEFARLAAEEKEKQEDAALDKTRDELVATKVGNKFFTYKWEKSRSTRGQIDQLVAQRHFEQARIDEERARLIGGRGHRYRPLNSNDKSKSAVKQKKVAEAATSHRQAAQASARFDNEQENELIAESQAHPLIHYYRWGAKSTGGASRRRGKPDLPHGLVEIVRRALRQFGIAEAHRLLAARSVSYTQQGGAELGAAERVRAYALENLERAFQRLGTITFQKEGLYRPTGQQLLRLQARAERRVNRYQRSGNTGHTVDADSYFRNLGRISYYLVRIQRIEAVEEQVADDLRRNPDHISPLAERPPSDEEEAFNLFRRADSINEYSSSDDESDNDKEKSSPVVQAAIPIAATLQRQALEQPAADQVSRDFDELFRSHQEPAAPLPILDNTPFGRQGLVLPAGQAHLHEFEDAIQRAPFDHNLAFQQLVPGVQVEVEEPQQPIIFKWPEAEEVVKEKPRPKQRYPDEHLTTNEQTAIYNSLKLSTPQQASTSASTSARESTPTLAQLFQTIRTTEEVQQRLDPDRLFVSVEQADLDYEEADDITDKVPEIVPNPLIASLTGEELIRVDTENRRQQQLTSEAIEIDPSDEPDLSPNVSGTVADTFATGSDLTSNSVAESSAVGSSAAASSSTHDTSAAGEAIEIDTSGSAGQENNEGEGKADSSDAVAQQSLNSSSSFSDPFADKYTWHQGKK